MTLPPAFSITWERVSAADIRVGDLIKVEDGDVADVTAIVTGPSTAYRVEVHKSRPDGPDFVVHGIYTPQDTHVLRKKHRRWRFV